MPKSAIDLGVTVVLSPEKIAGLPARAAPQAHRVDPMNPELAEIADLVRRETGIVLPAARETALRAAVERAAPGLGAAAFVRATSDPAGGRDLVTRLIDEVTNQETFFVRDRGQLDEIPWHALLQRARAAGSGVLRVWCAGCATGEEAYTLALLAAQAFAPAAAPVDVLGTDVSRAALAAAAAGRYRRARRPRALEPPCAVATSIRRLTAATSSAISRAAWCASARTIWPATPTRPPVKQPSTSSPAGTCLSTSAHRSSRS